MLRLQTVQKIDRDLLWNINQKYLYEMTNLYDDPMDENGNYQRETKLGRLIANRELPILKKLRSL